LQNSKKSVTELKWRFLRLNAEKYKKYPRSPRRNGGGFFAICQNRVRGRPGGKKPRKTVNAGQKRTALRARKAPEIAPGEGKNDAENVKKC
jgi:hypothetical protein